MSTPGLLGSQRRGSTDYGPALSATRLRAGEFIEVRSEAEIRATLDSEDSLETLPFMPEMRKFCGGAYTVLRPVNKVIVEGRDGLRRMKNAVILNGVTCNGDAHEGCRATCSLLWKEAWLKRIGNPSSDGKPRVDPAPLTSRSPHTQIGTSSCQSASLFQATQPLHFWNVSQYLWDLQDGTLRPHLLARTWLIVSYNRLRRRLGLRKHYLFHGRCTTTPIEILSLQPGELVEVKSKDEIAATLDGRGRNRGLSFTHEMLRCCGHRYRVLKRVERMIVEATGKMQPMTNTVLLEGAACDGEAHFNCQRTCRFLWKEVWLRRLE